MKCIKTGITVYSLDTDTTTRVDMFFDGRVVYFNQNDRVAGRQGTIECVCDSIDDIGRYNLATNPRFTKSVIDYVNSPYSGYTENLFIEKFGSTAVETI